MEREVLHGGKGSFDPYEFTIIGIVAAIRQAENSDLNSDRE